MKNKYFTSRDPIKNYFPLPNEVFALGLSPGALAVYSYLMYIEDRTTYQCHASYKTIGKAVNMSPNTVRKYVTELVERGLIKTERTTIITQDGHPKAVGSVPTDAAEKRLSARVSRVWRLCPVFRTQPGACPPETQIPDVAPPCGSVAESAKRRTNSREKSCFAASASKMPEKAKPSDFGRCGGKAGEKPGAFLRQPVHFCPQCGQF